jgi:predicted permease
MSVGRPLTPADDMPGAAPAAVLSHSFWMRAFGGDPDIVGRTIRVNSLPVEVVGVTRPGFIGMSLGGFFPQTEVTLPMAHQPALTGEPGETPWAEREEALWVRLMVRVPEGVSWAAAEQTLQAALRAAPGPLVEGQEHLPELRLIDGSQGAQPVRPEMARLLWLLLGVVASVLLIACVNLASLMFARGVARQRELAVRRALGGGRRRIVRQLLAEALVLAGTGTGLGIALALAARSLFHGLLTSSLGIGAFGDARFDAGLDPAVLAVSVGLGFGTTLLFGLLPALRVTGVDPSAWLRQRAGGGTPRATVGRLLIALQIAVSVPLVVGAGLFLRTAANLGSVELGFEPRGLVTFRLDPGFTGLPESEHPRIFREVLAAVAPLDGVRSVSLLEQALLGGIVSNSIVEMDGERVPIYFNAVGPGLFETLGVRLVEGRAPGIQDGPDAPRVAVLNETAVRELFGGASPVGRTLELNGREVRVVGVVGDTPYRSRREPVPATVHESAFQRSGYGGHEVVMRVDGPVGPLEARVRDAIHGIHPDLPVPELRAQTEIMARTSARERIFTVLLTAFGAFALLLASVGLHGVTAYAVTRRTRELGVRMAVGARPGQIVGLVLEQVVGLAGAGLLVGVPLALWAGPLVESLVYGVAPTDPVTVLLAGACLLAVAVAAGLLPALRAARMDVNAALRME